MKVPLVCSPVSYREERLGGNEDEISRYWSLKIQRKSLEPQIGEASKKLNGEALERFKTRSELELEMVTAVWFADSFQQLQWWL